ncbi:DinB family protein [Bacillus atrophaeus]
MTHKIHHIGQLSVWTRELGIPPVAANFFNRTILLPPQKTASNKRMLLVSHFNASCH